MNEDTTKTAAPTDAATATPVPKAEAAPKGPGIGDRAKALIREGKTNQEVLTAIKAEFPGANTSMASINWYRNKLRTDGENVPTSRELAPKKEKPAKKEKAKTEGKGKGKGTKADKQEAAQDAAAGAAHLQ